MKQVFNGENGYAEQGGQKRPMTSDQIAASKIKNSLFEELSLDMSKVTLESLTSIKGADAYKLKVDGGKNPEYRYYNTKTGYLVKTEQTVEMGGQKATSIMEYDNYTPTSGIMVPYNLTTKQGPQTFGMSIKKVVVNNDVSDADFN